MLINLNAEIFNYKIEMLQYLHFDPAKIFTERQLFNRTLRSRWLMVFGEGAVFLSLLIFGIYKVKNAFRKEFELAKQQKNFLLSITHEFKSPLAAVKLNLQTIQKRQLAPNQKDEIIRKALVETERINLLIENALIASRLESHNYDYYFERFDLSSFISENINEFINLRDHDYSIKHSIEPGIFLNGDKFALSSLLFNLIENSEKYSPKGTTIEIKLEKTKSNEALLSIKDEGYGIPENEKIKVFEKFYRIGNEDTRKTKGTGLGLFIVHHVVDLHKGKIFIKDNFPKGSIFEIYIPII